MCHGICTIDSVHLFLLSHAAVPLSWTPLSSHDEISSLPSQISNGSNRCPKPCAFGTRRRTIFSTGFGWALPASCFQSFQVMFYRIHLVADSKGSTSYSVDHIGHLGMGQNPWNPFCSYQIAGIYECFFSKVVVFHRFWHIPILVVYCYEYHGLEALHQCLDRLLLPWFWWLCSYAKAEIGRGRLW